MAQPTKKEQLFDQRLFNQTSGLDSGFGHEEDYNAYDKPLFADKTAQSIYKAPRGLPDEEFQSEKPEIERVLARVPNRGFEGAERKGPRTRPVQFEKRADDYFGMDDFVPKIEKKVKL